MTFKTNLCQNVQLLSIHKRSGGLLVSSRCVTLCWHELPRFVKVLRCGESFLANSRRTPKSSVILEKSQELILGGFFARAAGLQHGIQGSVLGRLLFIVNITGLCAYITPRGYLFHDDIKCTSKYITTLLEDTRQTSTWTDSLCIQLNVAKFQHFILGSGLAPLLDMLNTTGELNLLPHMKNISDIHRSLQSRCPMPYPRLTRD